MYKVNNFFAYYSYKMDGLKIAYNEVVREINLLTALTDVNSDDTITIDCNLQEYRDINIRAHKAYYHYLEVLNDCISEHLLVEMEFDPTPLQDDIELFKRLYLKLKKQK